MEVRAGRAAGRADVADDVAALHRLARLDVEPAQVAVARRQPEVVPDDDQVAVVAGVRGRLDRAVGGRVDRLALLGRDVEPLMEAGLAGERIRTAAEACRSASRAPARSTASRRPAPPAARRRAARSCSRLSRPWSRSRSTPKVSSGGRQGASRGRSRSGRSAARRRRRRAPSRPRAASASRAPARDRARRGRRGRR